MNIIEKLNRVAVSIDALSKFNIEYSDDLHSFFVNQNYSSLYNYKDEIDCFIHNNYRNIKVLNYSEDENKIFIDVLLDVCERLNLASCFLRLYKLKVKKKLSVSKRNEATSLCINGLRTFDDFINVLPSFLNKLQDAFETEEDNNKRILAVFFNYYSIIVRDFGEHNFISVKSFVEIVKSKKNNYSFFTSDITDAILSLDISNSAIAFSSIHSIIDDFLDREVVELSYSHDNFIIEEETDYINELYLLERDIYEIRKLSCKLFNGSDDVYQSLGRGVTVLSDSQQLYSYLNSYGKMHFAKCDYAYEKLPRELFDSSIEIIDYGCGQALASMAYLDYLNKQNATQNIVKITLNEPSLVALKRGAAHIRFFNPNVEILTINKHLDHLSPVDFSDNSNVKLHLFSNILDITDYSTKQLANLIKERFKGENYFVIISPKINDLKTNRIDSFVKEFESFNPVVFAEKNKGIGEWKGCCTMVLRMFYVNII